MTIETLELKLPDRFGVYLRWPEDGDQWIHPEDIDRCKSLIPSNRIFQRHREDEIYNRLEYGKISIRVKPSLWLEVETDGYLIGDRVEIRSQMGKRRAAIATIEETLFNRTRKAVEYILSINHQRLSEPFFVSDFQPAFKLDEPLDARQRELMEKARMSS